MTFSKEMPRKNERNSPKMTQNRRNDGDTMSEPTRASPKHDRQSCHCETSYVSMFVLGVIGESSPTLHLVGEFLLPSTIYPRLFLLWRKRFDRLHC
jgi:hypothetical protein